MCICLSFLVLEVSRGPSSTLGVTLRRDSGATKFVRSQPRAFSCLKPMILETHALIALIVHIPPPFNVNAQTAGEVSTSLMDPSGVDTYIQFYAERSIFLQISFQRQSFCGLLLQGMV